MYALDFFEVGELLVLYIYIYKVMIIPCNCCFSDYKLSGALNQRSSCCACMNWYLSS